MIKLCLFQGCKDSSIYTNQSMWYTILTLKDKNRMIISTDAEKAFPIPGSGRSPGVEDDNTFHYSCLENPMNREAWWGTIHRVAKSQTWLSTHMPSVEFSLCARYFTGMSSSHCPHEVDNNYCLHILNEDTIVRGDNDWLKVISGRSGWIHMTWHQSHVLNHYIVVV